MKLSLSAKARTVDVENETPTSFWMGLSSDVRRLIIALAPRCSRPGCYMTAVARHTVSGSLPRDTLFCAGHMPKEPASPLVELPHVELVRRILQRVNAIEGKV